MTEEPKKSLEDLGDDFEIIEDPGASAPAAAPPPAAVARPGGPVPVRGATALTSLGLAIGLAGLLGDWNGNTFNLAHGMILAMVLWSLLRSGLATVQPVKASVHWAVPGMLAIYAAVRVFVELTQNQSVARTLLWKAQGEAPDITAVSGAVFAFLGGAIALIAPRLSAKKDAKLPPVGNLPAVDKQFSGSLLAYLLCAIGLVMPWSPAASGAASLFGVITLSCVLLALWASWVGMWKLWTMPLVTGKMGLILFLAPIEALVMGLGSFLRMVDPLPDLVAKAWEGPAEPFLVYYGGGIMVLIGASLALFLLISGAKQALTMSAEKKKQETEARKSARAAKKAGPS